MSDAVLATDRRSFRLRSDDATSAACVEANWIDAMAVES